MTLMLITKQIRHLKKITQMNKVIYLITTYKCSACKLQKHLLQTALVGCDDIKFEEYKLKAEKWVAQYGGKFYVGI